MRCISAKFSLLCRKFPSTVHTHIYIYCPVIPSAGRETTRAMTITFEEIFPFCICLSLSFHILPSQPHQRQWVGLTTLKLSIHAQAPVSSSSFITCLTRIKNGLPWRGEKVIYDPRPMSHVRQRRRCGECFKRDLILPSGMSKTLIRNNQRQGSLTVVPPQSRIRDQQTVI